MIVRCDSCGDAWEVAEEDDKVAQEEARAVFPAEEIEGPVAVVCDDCLNRLRGADPSLDRMYREAGL